MFTINFQMLLMFKISNSANQPVRYMFYLTGGYTGEGMVFLSRNRRVIVTDFRYTEQAENQAPGYEVQMTEKDRSAFLVIAELAQSEGITCIRTETNYLSVDRFEKLRAALGEEISCVSLEEAPQILRQVKTPTEILAIRKACNITAEAFRAILPKIREGMTELELRLELETIMFRLGAATGKVGRDDEGAKKQLELLRSSLNHTQASLRAALWGLTEEAEGPAALTELFKYAASRMPQWEGVVRFTVRGHERAVARQCSGALLLIMQEAIGNALRHGHARKVDVVVDFTDNMLIFGVTDDGCGFDANLVPSAGHLGIDSMRKHAEGIGGTLTLASAIGKGTALTVRIPL